MRFTAAKLLLPSLLLLAVSCTFPPKMLRNEVKVEHVNNKLGRYLIVYDYEIESEGYKVFDVDNRMKCRMIQFTTNKHLSSVGQNSRAKGLECKIHDLPLGEIKLKPSPGKITFYRTSVNKFYPASNGLFYTFNDTLVPGIVSKEICCKNNGIQEQPFVKTGRQKQILLAYMNTNNINYCFVGARKNEKEAMAVWDDDTVFPDEEIVQSDATFGPIVFGDDNFYYNSDQLQAYCVCVNNIFSLPLHHESLHVNI